MNVAEWEFPPWHPVVLDRPREDTRWIAPLPYMRPRAYTPYEPPGSHRGQQITEPLRMDMVGHPSVDIHQTANGSTVQTVRLYSSYAHYIDLARIRVLAKQWYESLRRLSLGPYSLQDLAEMGHPYGYDGADPWRRLRNGRTIPRFSAGQRHGARRLLPNRAVVNLQSGDFERAWRYSVLPFSGGLTINFWNETLYSWFLAHGTIRMQAHGPWAYVANEMLPEVQEAWRLGAMAAARQVRAMEEQFGTEAVAGGSDFFDAGGWQ